MKVIIVAGGTGGHFYPGLAVAKELMAGNNQVKFVVRKKDYVIPLLQRENISFFVISAAGFERTVHPRLLLTFIKLGAGFIKSFFIHMKFRPRVILAMGGYLSIPVSLAGWMMGIPTILHEQNVRPGLANKFLSRFAKKIAVSFDESNSYFPLDKSVMTGNPIRPLLQNLNSKEVARKNWGLVPDRFTILVFGGSLGAHRVNKLMVQAVQELDSEKIKFQVAHFTGKKDKEWVEDLYGTLNVPSVVDSYCHQMEKAYAMADLVVCRAGASTVTELLAVKRPALLIPYPYATENHQLINARVLEGWGVAKVFEENELEGGKLVKVLRGLLEQTTKIKEMELNFQNIKNDPFQSTNKVIGLLREI